MGSNFRNIFKIQDGVQSALSQKQRSKHTWQFVDSGAFNKVWRSKPGFHEPLLSKKEDDKPYMGPFAYKQPIDKDAYNDPSRAVRVYNQIHQRHDHVQAATFKRGWLSTFFENAHQASDEEIASLLVDVYKETGRIILDAPTNGNVLADINAQDTTATLETVDVDLALTNRSNSPNGFESAEALATKYRAYLSNEGLRYSKPKSMETLNNIIYFEHYFPYPSEEHKLLTVDVISTFTWLRENDHALNSALLNTIVNYTKIGVTPSGHILKGLINNLDKEATHSIFMSKPSSPPASETQKVFGGSPVSFFRDATPVLLARKPMLKGDEHDDHKNDHEHPEIGPATPFLEEPDELDLTDDDLHVLTF